MELFMLPWNDEVDGNLLVAFVQHADALLNDLERHRSGFWQSHLEVVDAVLSEASDKVKHKVDVLLAGARVRFEQRYGNEPEELVQLVRRLEEDRGPGVIEGLAVGIGCPVCQAPAFLHGKSEEEQGGGDVLFPAKMSFDMSGFFCRICGLQLRSKAELTAAGLRMSISIVPGDSTGE